MKMPFTVSQFIALFESYNTAIWPLQPVAYTAALGALGLLFVAPRRRGSDPAVAGTLAAFWAISGVGYLLLGMTRLSPAAYLFALGFGVEVALLAAAAVRGELTFAAPSGWRATLSGLILGYAVVGYPLIGLLVGRAPVQSPWLGVAPCPTTIFTIGLLLRSASPAARRLLVVPILWSAVGTVAALRLGIAEDLGMTVSAIAALAVLAVHRRGAARRELPVRAAC